MPNKKEFRTDIVLSGKVNPSLRQASNTACKALGAIKNTMLSTIGIASAGAVVVAVKTMGQSFIKAASDLQETQGKINQVFGGSSNVVENWSKTSIKAMGLAQQTALDSAALYGDMATGMNIPKQKAAEMAMTLTKLGADMASFKNISGDMASTALKSVFTGETESLKGLGIVMTQAQLQEYALSKGIRKKIKDMKESEMVMLRYNFVLSKTKNSQGDFARTAINAANQQRIYNEQIKEYQTRLGNLILPAYTKALREVNKFLAENGDTIVAGFTKAVGAANNFYKALKQVSDFVQNNWPAVVSVVTAIGGAAIIASFNNLAWAVLGAAINFGTLAVSAWGVIAPMIPIAASIAAITYAIVTCTQAIQKFNEQRVDLKTNPLKELTPEEAKKVREYNARKRPAEITARHNALGSKSFVGGETWVGEHGPERVRLPRWSEIASNNKSMQQSGASVGDIIINMTFNGNTDAGMVKSAVSSTVPSVKQQIEAYFKERQRKGLAFA